METLNQPTHPTDYRLAKLMDGSLLMGTISVDDEHMRIINPLELVTIPRMTNEGLKEDTTLSKWIPFTDDIDKILDIAELEENEEEPMEWDEEATNVIGGHVIDSKKLH